MSSDTPDSLESGAGITAKVKDARIEDEVERSYIDYAMSVITGRTLPDVHDGLGPVHRRILYAMHQASVTSNSSHRRSLFIVGEMMGDYYLHGDFAVYDILARMAQGFSMCYPFVDGQGDFSSVGGDPSAAIRYTEVRMSPVAEELLDDIDKDTIDFQLNHSDHKQEPTVLLLSFPSLLVNGSSGAAIGVSTNISPHDLGEVVDATVELTENPGAIVADLTEHIEEPDFPADVNTVGCDAVRKAYKTGRDRIRVRADYDVLEREGRIVINGPPCREDKVRFIECIVDDVNEGKIEGIRDIRDKSDHDGIHIVIELKCGVMAEVVKNRLLDNHFESTFGVINLALVDEQPRVLTLKETPEHYLDHYHGAIRRRSGYEPVEAENRIHILDGRLKALSDTDDVVEIIRNSKSRDDAKTALHGEIEVEVGGEPLPMFDSSEERASHIISMRLGSFALMRAAEIKTEYEDVQATIERLETILGDQSELDTVIESELLDTKDEYTDDRRISFVTNTDEITRADPILERDMVVVVSEDDYVKRVPTSRFHGQHRGGKSIIGADLKEGDNVSSVLVTNTHDDLFCFTNHGQVYQLKAYQVPETSWTVRGKSTVNLLDFDDGEEITAIVNYDDLEDIEGYLTMVTRNGRIKRTGTDRLQNILLAGIIATKLDEGDELVDAEVTGGESDPVISTERGMSIRFDEDEVYAMECSARGVRGIKFEGNGVAAGVTAIGEDHHNRILTVTENGYGERTDLGAYHIQSRSGKGLIGIKANERNGPVYTISIVSEGDHLVVVSGKGRAFRTPVEDISTVDRNTMSVIAMDFDESDDVASIDVIPAAMTAEGEELDDTGSVEEDAGTDVKADAKADTGDE